ncbi:hypothetical protein ACFLYX_04380, partial [Chloroflexota bacterium]
VVAVFNLIVAPFIVSLIFIYALIKIYRDKSTSARRSMSSMVIFAAYLVIMMIIYATPQLEAKDMIQIVLTVGLVIATGFYAVSAKRQADANMKMAEEMREQRRPIVVAEAVSSGVLNGVEFDYAKADIFKVRNLGNNPAIELEVLLLNQGERLLGSERRTFLAQTDEPIEFWPSGLEGQLNYTCYLVCRYRSSDEGKMCYLTKLPFVPKKSQRGDRIIIEPQELEFSRAFEKQSY